MSNDIWYEVCSGDGLRQGDILRGCEVFVPDVSAEPGSTQVAALAHELDLVVLTQSCDLENQGKVDDVLLVELHSYDTLASNPGFGKDFRAKCIAGRYPAYFVLRPFSGEPAMSWSIVDFRRVHALPLSYASGHASRIGNRLRLRSPYREHLSQSFARYFMRVGLPKGIDDFKNFEPANA